MKPHRCGRAGKCAVVAALGLLGLLSVAVGGEREPQFAEVNVVSGREGCSVELDSASMGKTDASGTLTLPQVEPGDHYVHIRCAGEKEKAIFISPSVGEKVEVRYQDDKDDYAASLGLEVAEIRIRLRQHVQEAFQLRARGRIEEAVEHLRSALKLDPQNADLHRELGISFLLAKDWKRARVEMLEAIRHSPDNADAYGSLGYALEKLGDLEGAVQAYGTAVRLDPHDLLHRQHYFGAMAKLVAQRAEKKKP